MRWSRFLAPLAVISCFAVALAAQGTGQITGLVTDRLQVTPLSNATVTVLGSSASASTGADGRYSLTVRPGHHQVRTTHLGFVPRLDTVNRYCYAPHPGDFDKASEGRLEPRSKVSRRRWNSLRVS